MELTGLQLYNIQILSFLGAESASNHFTFVHITFQNMLCKKPSLGLFILCNLTLLECTDKRGPTHICYFMNNV